MTGALVRRGKSGHTCEDGGRGGARSYAPRIANNHRRRDTGLQRILPQSLQQELTSDTLVSDLWPPQLRERISVVLSPPVCGVLLQQPWGLIHAATLSVFLPPPDSTGASGSHRWRHTSIFAEGSIGQFRSTLRTLLGERSKDGQFWFSEKVNACWVGPIPSSVSSIFSVPVLPQGGAPSLSRGNQGHGVALLPDMRK